MQRLLIVPFSIPMPISCVRYLSVPYPFGAVAVIPIFDGYGRSALPVFCLAGFRWCSHGWLFHDVGRVLHIQCLDLVAPEKRTNTFGNVGCCCGCCLFQLGGGNITVRLHQLLVAAVNLHTDFIHRKVDTLCIDTFSRSTVVLHVPQTQENVHLANELFNRSVHRKAARQR